MQRSFLMLFALFAVSALLAQSVEQYYHSLPNVKPKERERFFYEMRAYPYDRIPFRARVQAMEQAEALKKRIPAQILAEQPEWYPIGPFFIGGRARTVVVHPNDPATAWIGAAAGGIWKTTDYGQSWEPVFDYETAIAMGSLAIDFNNPDVLLAATGEMSSNIDAYLGDGIFRSTDGGITWEQVGLVTVGAFSKIWIHPQNSNLVIAGATKNGAGVYRSTDGGMTWEKTFDGIVSDVSMNPSDPNQWFIGVTGKGVYYSGDGGQTWFPRNSGFPISGIGRVSVQQAPSDPNILYALMEVQGIGMIYKSTDQGGSWENVYAGSQAFFRGQGWYDQYIVVHPTNPDIVLAGGIDIWRTTDGGQTWVNVTNGYGGGPLYGGDPVHVDQHHAAFAPSNPNVIYAVNDGGAYLSTDAGRTWKNINNNLTITQFYAMDVDQSAENKTYGGTQDNGTLGNYQQEDRWNRVAGGDGFYVVVDYENPHIIYGEFPRGQLWKRNLQTGEFKRITDGIPSDDPGLWSAPIAIDPEDPMILYHGRTKLYINSFGGEEPWEVISAGFPSLDGSISAIGISPVDPEILYIGTSRGEVYRSTDGGETWTGVTENGLVNRFVTDIVCSEQDAYTAFIAFSGFGAPHLFRTTDAGDSWENISQALPDIPCNAIAVHPENDNVIFVGTDIGVFATYDGGVSWVPYGTELPRVPVVDLRIHKESMSLRAATHGRSMWEVPIETSIEAFAITRPAGGEDFSALSTQPIAWYGFALPVKVEYSLDDGQSWQLIAENVSANSIVWRLPGTSTITARVRVSSLTNPDQVAVTPRFSIQPVHPGAILKLTGVSHVPYGIAYDGEGYLWATSFYGNRLYKYNAETLELVGSFVMPVGDSLFTDITINRKDGTIYVHKMASLSGGQGIIIALDQNGNLKKTYLSPATQYPIGLVWLEADTLLVGDRNLQKLYVYDLSAQQTLATYDNPFTADFGPRGLCRDPEGNIYQVSTDFTGGSLQGAYLIKIPAGNYATEIDRLSLSGPSGTINARGADYDQRDGTFWLSDFGGTIYKIVGFQIPNAVEQPSVSQLERLLPLQLQHIVPNPVIGKAVVTLQIRQAGKLTVELYSIDGKFRQTVVEKNVSAGTFAFPLQPQISSGPYLLRFLFNGEPVATTPFTFIR